jgi:hypothetical protein
VSRERRIRKEGRRRRIESELVKRRDGARTTMGFGLSEVEAEAMATATGGR